MSKRMMALGALMISATFTGTATAQQAGAPASQAPQSQQQQMQQQQMQQLPKASEFSDKQLDAFADA